MCCRRRASTPGSFRGADCAVRSSTDFTAASLRSPDAGNNLIVEHIIEDESWIPRLLRLLGSLDVFFVGVRCPLHELERRERERGDRRIGEAKSDYAITHTFALYDMEVDATLPADRNVDSIIAAWKARALPNAFDRMVRRAGPG